MEKLQRKLEHYCYLLHLFDIIPENFTYGFLPKRNICELLKLLSALTSIDSTNTESRVLWAAFDIFATVVLLCTVIHFPRSDQKSRRRPVMQWLTQVPMEWAMDTKSLNELSWENNSKHSSGLWSFPVLIISSYVCQKSHLKYVSTG